MIKRSELASPSSCLNKAADDEPIFVLRGKDKLAAGLVREWARQYAVHNATEKMHFDVEKYREAMALADQMEAWTPRKIPD